MVATMVGKTVSHYKILARIGKGGMGVVYKAEDVKLERIVALKFLSHEALSGEEEKARFVREAKAAAAVSHPNICTVHDIEDTEDHTFIVLEYIKGQSLKDMLKSGPLELAVLADLTIQVMNGLRLAHERGITHRDVKPGNVMVTAGGQVKIMDFGLAKRSGHSTVTKSNATPGTASYMSPEQVCGDKVDQRSDIWSLGVMIYEMATGELPFRGGSEHAIFYSILNLSSKPISSLRSDIPPELEQVIVKATAKDPQQRYQDVEQMQGEFEVANKAIMRSLGDVESSAPFIEPSVAVLPFENLSPDKDQDYFCDGIVEDITTQLVLVKGLRVVSRTSAFVFKGEHKDIREIGRQLNVGTVLEGSVRKAGDRIRIAAQLIDVGNGYHIWSEQYERDLNDVFSIQDEIAQRIARALKLKLTEEARSTFRKATTRDLAAYDLYLRGRKFLYMTQRRSFDFAREVFLQAIGRDDNYALAYAGIADSYSFKFMYSDSNENHLKESLVASKRCLELDPELAEGHASRGLALSLMREYDEAEREFDISMRLNPNLYEGHYFYARNCYAQGNLGKAARLFEKAWDVKPEDFQAPIFLALCLRGLGLNNWAADVVERAIGLIEGHVQMNPDDARAYVLGASALVELGHSEKGMEWANRALSIDPHSPSTLYCLACVHVKLERIEEAFYYLEKALEGGPVYRDWIEKDSDLDPIRDHDRFKSLLKRL